MKKFVLSFFLLTGALIAKAANAIKFHLGGLDAAAGNAGFVERTVTDITGSVIGIVLSLIGALFLILMIYGGIMWMTASGSIERVGKAKKLIVAGVVGLIIVLSAFAITSFIGDRLSPTLIK
ncbi:MAG: hypothetical protein ABIG10_01040 [bacterium]